MFACGVCCSPVCALSKGCAGNGVENDPTEAFAVMCRATQVSPMLPDGSDFLTAQGCGSEVLVLLHWRHHLGKG